MPATMSSPLQSEFEYFIEHQVDLVSKYPGKFVVIKDQAVIGVYDDELKAVRETSKTYELGTFLVQLCESGAGNYTQSYHSRVVFA